MKLKELIHTDCGLRYIVDSLEIQSGVARRMLLDTEWMMHEEGIRAEYASLASAVEALREVDHQPITTLQFRLAGLKDLRTTLANLAAGATLDDIELFEIKHLAMLTTEVNKSMSAVGLTPTLPDTEEAVRILDPDGMRIATFFVYDSYSPRLHELRKQLEANPEDEQIFNEAQDEELRIRKQLSDDLCPMAEMLANTLVRIAHIDILVAKALQVIKWSLCYPKIVAPEENTHIEDLWNPEVEAQLAKQCKTYQRNSIRLGAEPTILTGSNMGGKTVVLKTVALCQMLTQFGLGLPARAATLSVRSQVLMSINDNQSITSGLSSFAAEMMRINTILRSARGDHLVMILIDEPARTTNPVEGTALVSGLIEVLRETHTTCLMVTHYTINAHGCPCLRVKGMTGGQMDYTLVPAKEGDVPHEALTIAEQLGIDEEWLQSAKQHLTSTP